MTKRRMEDLLENWESEVEDQEWREDLTEEETALVESWDRAYSRGVEDLCADLIARQAAPADP